MAQQHKVRFEPVGIEIEVSEDETILNGAFRQGLQLPHGCKEGQCASCKSFLLDGEVDLEKYSTFALADYEEEEGYTLLCRAHAYSDIEVELLHYDEEMLRSGTLVQVCRAEVAAIEELTHDIRRLSIRLVDPAHVMFNPGQYVDIGVPGTGVSRSFSMANTSSEQGVLEFMVKVFPDGRFSGLLANELSPGAALELKGPYGVFVLREASSADLLFLGGGAGMAPIWALLCSMAERQIARKATYYYGARTRRDLFHLDELERLADRLPNFRFVPALSEAGPDDAWDGEEGFVTDVVDRMEGDLSGVEAYLCGPPPMIDAAIPLLERKGVPEGKIFFDKFTSTANPDEVGV